MTAAGRKAPKSRLTGRILVCIAVCIAALLGFYISLIASARPLAHKQWATVRRSIENLRLAGFDREVMLLETITVFRSDDNWLNASVAKETAYAATNFPFEIMTLYPDFFTYASDDTERAAILLHEARHLMGEDEHEAYEYVWRNKKRLGWTRQHYSDSIVWDNIRRQTRDHVPHLFVCDFNQFNDCAE